MPGKNDLSETKVMPVMGHVRELQIRLTIAAVVLIIAASLAYVFRDQIITLLLSPLHGQQLIYLNPAGGFSFILLVSVYTGLAFTAPVAIYQIYSFIRPILSEKSKKNSLFIFLSSIALLVAGVSFGYIFAIPGALNFLYTFAGDYVEASLTADSYLNFIVAYTLGIGLIFQLPLLLMIIHWINPLTPSGLMKSQRWIIILAFIAAAIITPTPDPLNQTIIALPIILVYQLGVIAVLINIFKEKRRSKKALLKVKPAQPSPPAKLTDSLPLVETKNQKRPAIQLEKHSAVEIKKPALNNNLIQDMGVNIKPIKPVSPAQGGVKRSRSVDGLIVAPARSGAPKYINPPRRQQPSLARQGQLSATRNVQQARQYHTGKLSLDGVSKLG